LGVRLLDDDHRLTFYHLGFHLLLLVRLQIAGVLGLLAHALHSLHHVVLLREEGVAKVGRPLNIIGESLHDIRKRRHGLNTWVPGFL
jgi:hypothetical protein